MNVVANIQHHVNKLSELARVGRFAEALVHHDLARKAVKHTMGVLELGVRARPSDKDMRKGLEVLQRAQRDLDELLVLIEDGAVEAAANQALASGVVGKA